MPGLKIKNVFMGWAEMPELAARVTFSLKQRLALRPHDYQHKTIAATGLGYAVSGDAAGRRVICIHGTPGSHRVWEKLLRAPLPDTEIVAVDRLGFGRSGKNAVTGYQEQAAAIAPLLESRNGRKTIIVGHSLGGPIAARLAAMYPEQVGGLIIVAGSLDPELEKLHILQRVFVHPVLRRLWPHPLGNTALELLAARHENQKLQPELSKITCPVTVIHGTADRLVPYANTVYAKRHMPRAALVTLSGRSHFIPQLHAGHIRNAIMAMR